MENTDAFFDQPQGGDGPGFVVNGRYAIKHPETGRDTTWQRASNYAAPLSDHHAIARWQLRELIRGLNRREDLVELIRTATELDNPTIDRWITAAHETAAIDAKANRGTAVHEVLRAFDAGMQYSERYAHIVHGYGSELDRQGLTPVGWEVVVLNTGLGAAGRLDRVYRERDGAYVLGDVKTGRLDYAVHDFAVQLAVYTTAKYIVDDQGNPRPLPWVLRQDYAVLIHVDPVTGESSTYRIDMTLGRRAANLAAQVRAWRNTKDVALPYVPPDLARVVESDGPPAGLTEHVADVAAQAVADVRARSTALGYAPDAPLTAEHVAHVNAGIAPGQTVTVLNPVQVANLAVPGEGPRAGMADAAPGVVAGTVATAPGAASGVERVELPGGGWTWEQTAAPEPPAIDPETEAAELAKLPKVELQRMLKGLGGTDLAHHRTWLANEIVKRKNAAGQPDIVTVGTNAAGERSVTIDRTTTAVVPPTTTAVVPAAEQTPHALALIGAASSVADLSRIRDKIVSVGGDAAWTDEMTEAARARAAVLDQAARADVLSRIDAATSSADLAAVWAEITLSGTAPAHWTEEYQDRATARLAAINAATTAAPPVNPFAN